MVWFIIIIYFLRWERKCSVLCVGKKKSLIYAWTTFIQMALRQGITVLLFFILLLSHNGSIRTSFSLDNSNSNRDNRHRLHRESKGHKKANE